MRAYNLKAIKIEPADGREGKIPTTPNVGLGSDIIVSDLYSIVKTYDKNFHPGKSVSPSLLNANGTPKKWYHQTGETFTFFS